MSKVYLINIYFILKKRKYKMERSYPSNLRGSSTNPHECWEVYQKVLEETKSLDDYLDEECSPQRFDEGEQEAEWLRAAGLGELVEPWKEGREIQPEELGAALCPLSRPQAEAVKRRICSLNHTVKQRYNQRQRVRKPDIRDVFKDAEVSSTGTRSRSATPDSLDSISGERPERSTSSPLPPSITDVTRHHINSNVPNFVSMFHRNFNENREGAVRSPSVPSEISNTTLNSNSISLSVQEIFGRSNHWAHRGDVAGEDSEGIKLTAYQRLGTIHFSRPIERFSGRDQNKVSNVDSEAIKKSNISKNISFRRNSESHTIVTRSHSSLYSFSRPQEENIIIRSLNRTSSHGHLSFEEMCRANESKNQDWSSKNLTLDIGYTQQGIELLSQRDFTKLKPLLWLELTAIFDKYNIPLIRRKPNKRRRKSGNLFGVSLSTLLLRDNQLTNRESNIPLIFQKILYELTNRGVKEEGILRVGGHKQKVETLCAELETDFYCKPQEMDNIFKHIPCHDLSVVLKKLLRDLPQPLFTVELIDAFYHTHGIKNPIDLSYSLNLLVLILPLEHRYTLQALLTFLKLIIENQHLNKMSTHNVAMIVAPSLFPPRYIYPRDRTNLNAQVNMAAVCCQVTEAVLMNFEKLWDVPCELINQLQSQAKEERYRKFKKKYY